MSTIDCPYVKDTTANQTRRFLEGIGLGAGTMLAPTYVSENSPRAIRGFLVGFFQLLLVMGGMMAYFINYGALLHLSVSLTCRKYLTGIPY